MFRLSTGVIIDEFSMERKYTEIYFCTFFIHKSDGRQTRVSRNPLDSGRLRDLAPSENTCLDYLLLFIFLAKLMAINIVVKLFEVVNNVRHR